MLLAKLMQSYFISYFSNGNMQILRLETGKLRVTYHVQSHSIWFDRSLTIRLFQPDFAFILLFVSIE